MMRSPQVAGHATWRDIAACRHHDPELFFPIAAAGPALDQAEQARQVCQRCPAQEPCLRWALDRGVAFGIWGGTTEDERRTMRRTLVPPPSLALGRAGRAASEAGRTATAARRGTAGHRDTPLWS